MNVLKSLSENRFNDIVILAENIYIKSLCELNIQANFITHKIKKTSNANTLPIRCIITKDNKTIHLANIQQMTTYTPRDTYTDMNGQVVCVNKQYRQCEITLCKELTIEQINKLMLLFDVDVNNFNIEYICDFK